MLKVGDSAPEFELSNASGQKRTLSDLLSQGPLILFFYPADSSPFCTRQACALRDLYDECQSVNLTLTGINHQEEDSHQSFIAEHTLPFELLCDPGKTVARLYDALGPVGIGTQRITYLINDSKRIQDAVKSNLRVSKHIDFVQKAISLQRTA